MSLYALVEAERLRAQPDGPRRAQCPDCMAEMMAKTGNVVVWHWAHCVRPLDCQAASEGEWHLAWKALAIDGTQEITHPSGRRRADVLAPGGFAVEFQASPLTVAEIQTREADWDYNLVWVFDARKSFQKERLTTEGYGKSRRFMWRRPPDRIKGAKCPSYYDVGDDNLLRVTEVQVTKSAAFGQCWLETKDVVVTKVIRGKQMPPRPTVNVRITARGLQNIQQPTGTLHLRVIQGNGVVGTWVQIYFEGNPDLVAELSAQGTNFHRADLITPGSWVTTAACWFDGAQVLEKMFAPFVIWGDKYVID